MKTKFFAVMAICLAVISPVSAAEDVTGLQWLQLSAGQRMDHVRMSMAVLDYYGIKLKNTANDYYNAVSEKLRTTPQYYRLPLTDILAEVVSKIDPAAKRALEKHRVKS